MPKGVMRALLWVAVGGNKSPRSGLVQSSIAHGGVNSGAVSDLSTLRDS